MSQKKARIINVGCKPSSILCTKCFMCEESMELTEKEKIIIDFGREIQPRLCKKCKDAWIRFRDRE